MCVWPSYSFKANKFRYSDTLDVINIVRIVFFFSESTILGIILKTNEQGLVQFYFTAIENEYKF